MNYLPIEFGVLSGMRCGDVVPPNGSEVVLVYSGYFHLEYSRSFCSLYPLTAGEVNSERFIKDHITN